MDSQPINCSVTVMPICGIKVGFIRRGPGETFEGLLVAPGGKVEVSDGMEIEGVMYSVAECTAARELKEETGIEVDPGDLMYFCSLRLPNNRIVISLYIDTLKEETPGLVWLDKWDIMPREDFAPGMRQEAIELCDRLGLGV